MGNAHAKQHPKNRNNKKQVHWKAADRPSPPGKPHLLADSEPIPDLVTIRWSRPLIDGGSPISGYLVEHRRVGSPHWVRATPLPVSVPELTLSGLEPGWRYQFRATAENAVGYSNPSDVSDPITVTLQRSAVTAPKFTQEFKDTIALENDKCEFVVHFLGQPAPKVCWFKDGFEIFSSRRIRILTEPDRSILTIHQTSLADEGEIKCTATNRAGHISTKARLTVEAPPSIRLPRQYEDGLLFEIGEVIRLKVSVVGRPIPLTFWSHNGESLQSNDRYEIEYLDKALSLKINNAQRSDRGEYQIKAVNKLGEEVTSFLVTVTDKPSPPGKARVVMTLGRSVTLSWGAPHDDGGCKIGNYIVEYFRMGWNVWLKAATSRQLTTILGDLIEGSEYKFRIKAESPYGISEPSEESEIVFIPDPKRGLIQPPSRGRSQPKEMINISTAPTPVQRKRPRSQSSSRAEERNKPATDSAIATPSNVPTRPNRTKIKTPSRTPESSPMVQRKENINRNIFDRASIARDLAYGSPEIKVTNDFDFSTQNSSFGSADISRRSSVDEKSYIQDYKSYKVKIEPSMEVNQSRLTPSPEPKNKLGASPEARKKLIREHSATVSGSSEFMLVLYSDENVKDHSEMFDFDENSVPPPLSLSAPELGVEPPLMYPLRISASSTELLHERAMIRFYQAAETEEAELEKRRKASGSGRNSLGLEIPKIHVNSKEEENLVGLERKHSIRRKMSAGSITQPQASWAQRRQSLKSPTELKNDSVPTNLVKSPVYFDNKKDPLDELSALKNFKQPVSKDLKGEPKLHTQASFEKKAVTIAEEAAWMEKYEESLSESEVDSSDSEAANFKFQVMNHGLKQRSKGYGNEEDTYHPGRALQNLGDKNNEPFEILTKPKKLPDPNFVPKPILKRTDASPISSPAVSPPSSPVRAQRSLSPRPDIILKRNRSKSLAVPVLPTLNSSSSNEDMSDPPKPRSRSFSLTSAKNLFEMKESQKIKKNKPSINLPNAPVFFPSISAVAQISGITAASIVIPKKLLEQQADSEEAKVVADHYGDIVRNFGQRRKSNSQLYTDRDSLKRAAEQVISQDEDVDKKDSQSSKDNLSNDSGYQSSHRGNSVTDQYDPLQKSSYSNMFVANNQHIHTRQPVFNKKIDSYPESKIFVERDNTKKQTASTSTSFATFTFEHTELKKDNSAVHNFNNKENQQKSQTLPHNNVSQFLTKDVTQKIQQKSQTLPNSKQKHRQSSQSPMGRSVTTQSKSPTRRTPSVTRKPSLAIETQGLTTSKSEIEKTRKTSPSPIRQRTVRSVSRSSETPSPSHLAVKRPLLKEIMTQTSIGFESVALSIRTPSPSEDELRQKELLARAKVQVRGVVDYLNDLAMFAVACWLYLFDNELLAIPVLLFMVYRQLKEEISKRIPWWLFKKLKRKKEPQS